MVFYEQAIIICNFSSQVKAHKQAYVFLAEFPKVTEYNAYEIIIGALDNQV